MRTIDSLADPDLIAEGAAVLHIRSVYDFDGVTALDIDALADPAQTTADERPARFIRVVKAVSSPTRIFSTSTTPRSAATVTSA